MRFEVAFTFTRTSRDLVRGVADRLAATLGRDAILFDEYHQEELSTPRGGLTLLDWYQRESRMVVVVLSDDYDERGSWTHFEWPQVIGLIRSEGGDQSVLLLRNSDQLPHDFAGLGDMALAFDVRRHTAEHVAEVVERRLARVAAAAPYQPPSPSTARPAPVAHVTRPGHTVPAEVPAPPLLFAGRHEQMQTALAASSAGSGVTALVVSGPPGVGKSAFAAQLAHRARPGYPGGSLYVDLLGGTPGMVPVTPSEAVARLLRSLGTSGPDIPVALDEAASRLRTLLAERPTLVVLDNAAGAEQVRPLLPGPGSSLAVVTSRSELRGLDAEHLTLSHLSDAEGIEQLTHCIGHDRVTPEPEAARQLIRLCDNLPLAIRIVGARIAARPRWRLATMVELLQDERARLQELQLGDLGIRSSFQVSYDGLDSDSGRPDCRGVLRGIGTLGARLISVEMVGHLMDTPVHTARTLLEGLVDAQLLEGADAVRYRIHDLVRLFASEVADADPTLGEMAGADSPEAIDVGVGRVVEYLVDAASSAVRDLQRVDPRRSSAPAAPGQGPAVTFDESSLFDLVTVLSRAATVSHAHDAVVARSADAVFWYCHRKGYHEELRRVSELSLAAARRLDDRAAEASALHNLALASLRLARPAEARRFAEAAIAIRAELGDEYGLGRSHDARARALHLSGDSDAGLAAGLSALAIARGLADAYSESNVLCNLVPMYLALGQAPEAVAAGRRSVVLRRALGDPYGLARMGMSLGSAYAASGDLGRAVEEYEASSQTFDGLGDHYDLARCLVRLARTRRERGEVDEARACLERVVAIRKAMGDSHGLAEAHDLLDGFDDADRQPS